MIILRNQSKYPTWLLRLLLEELAFRVGYQKPLIVRVHDNCTGYAGEAHQGEGIHTIELEAPHAHTETVDTFVRNVLHEFSHVLNFDHDPDRSILKWSDKSFTGRWQDRPEERRAIRFAEFCGELIKDSAKVNMLKGLLMYASTNR